MIGVGEAILGLPLCPYFFNGNFFPVSIRFAFKNINAGDLVSIPRKIPWRR